jgi:hypothetical protein
MKRYFLEIFYGFVLAAVLALVPPIAFLAIPAAGFFLFVVPIWSIGVVGLLFFGLLIFGRIPSAIGVALLAIAVALPLLGMLSMPTKGVVYRATEAQVSALRQLKEKCATERAKLPPLNTASAKYNLIVFDSVDTRGEQNYDLADTVAVLTGMRVVEISRVGLDRRFDQAWETMAEHSNSCVGGRDSAKVGVTPRGSQRSIAALAVDVCLRRTKIPDPSRDRTPAVVLRHAPIPSGAMYCDVIEVVERMDGGDVGLGHVHYDSSQQRMYPRLALPKGVPQNNWLKVLLSEVLQQDLSDEALMGHALMGQAVKTEE